MRLAILALPLVLGLAACNSTTNNAAADIANGTEQLGDSLENIGEKAGDTIGNFADDAGATISNTAEDLGNRAEKVGTAIDNAVD